ncbi:MAG TPA: hypothetical protein ENJ18_10165 [Nannocystis exedens]|nr:hypothetical protein [Nannocystis exedens]
MIEPPTEPQVAELNLIGLPRLLFALWEQHFTGMVTVPPQMPRLARRTIWIRDGLPIFTDWQSTDCRLGQLLVDGGLIDTARCGQALHERRPKERLGQVLLRKNWIDSDQLGKMLRIQCARKLAESFSLRQGRVRIIPHDDLQGAGPNLTTPVDLRRLILIGITAHYDEARVFAEMGAAALGPLRADSSLDSDWRLFGFRPTDEPVRAPLLKGTRLSELLRMDQPPAARIAQLIYTLWACELLLLGSYALRPSDTATEDAANRFAMKPEVHAATFVAEIGKIETQIAVGAHAFDVLGLPLTADREEVRCAWRAAGSRFHPDALARQGFSHLRERVTDVFAHLSRAHHTLIRDDRREALRAHITEKHERRRARSPSPSANS